MLSINMDDVIKVLNSIKSQLIGFGVVAVLLIAVMIACRKQSKSKKYLIRWQAGLGMVLALAITVNLILTGPMYSMVTLATGGGKVSEENVASATQLCEDIADEGIVLLDNDGTLPMAKNSKLNVFGWASTNPCYGGTGSGALSDAYPTVTLLEGLKNAGFELNTELSDFYTSYRADRPVVGMFSKGDYVISINADSHTVLDSKVYNVASDIVYDASNKRESDVEVADNKFDFAEGNVTYLSRADGFANYAEATAAPADFELPAEAKATFYNNSNWNPEDFNNADDVAPTTGAKNGLKLKDMVGVDYNDAQWDAFLDQLTVADMDSLIALGGYQSVAVDSIGKVQAVDCDGPASINNNFTKQGSIGFPSAVMIAATWNTDLAHDFGTSIGKMADDMDVSGWYAPAMNIHRSAFAGRNFEYYSEDGVLSGAMAANAIMGSQEQGVYAFMKHFALNDQETNRCGMLCTWSNEQAIREIYLKPFEHCVKAADCHAVMSSFNYVGNTYAGNCSALLNDVLRGEWGFVGMVLTDYYGVYGYQDSDRLIRNGGDFCLVNYDTETNHLTDTTSATALVSARQACKNILYTVANSRAYYPENLNPGMPGWEKVMIGVDVVLAAALIALEVLVVKKGYAKRKEEEVNA